MEGNVSLCELRRQRIGMLNADECIPRCPMVSDGVGQGQYIDCYLLQEDPRLVPPDNCKKWILRWCTISYIKPCSHVERNRWPKLFHDKEGCDVAQHCASQASPAPRMMPYMLVRRCQAPVAPLHLVQSFLDRHRSLLTFADNIRKASVASKRLGGIRPAQVGPCH